VGNTSTSAVTTYILDTIAPSAPTIDSVSNKTGSPVSGNDATPQVVVSGVANTEYMILNVNKVLTGDADSTTFSRTSTGATFVYNTDTCESSGPCTFNLGGTAHNAVITASARDHAANVSTANPAVTYQFNNLGPALSRIDSMGSPADTTTPASGTDRTPPMVVAVSDTTNHIDIYRGTAINPIGTIPVAGHIVTCAVPAANVVCVGLNQAAVDANFTVSTGANILKARAIDNATNFRDSLTFEWDATDTKAPPKPTKPTSVLSSGGSLAINWDDVVDAADNAGDSSNPVTYEIVKASAAPDGGGACPDPNSLLFTSLQTGLTSSDYNDTISPIRNCYFYRVRAVDGARNVSLYSDISDAAGDRVAPTTPDAPVATLGTGGQVSIDWNTVTDAASNPVTYTIYKASTAPVANACPDASGLTFTSLQTGLTSSDYNDTISPLRSCNYYKVVAIDAATNASAQSASSGPAGDITPPATVAKPSVSKRSAGDNLVTWSAVTDPSPASNPITYELDRATADPGTAGDEASCPSGPSTAYAPVAGATALSTTSFTDTTTTDGKCTYYQVVASDAAGNVASPSTASDAVLVNTSAGPPTPSITSVNADATSPAYGSGAGSDRPVVVASVTEGAGTLRLFVDGVQVASKAISAPGPVTFVSGDYSGSVPLRSHVLTVDQVANSTTSLASAGFTYARPPAAPSITKVAGSTTSPTAANDPKPGVVIGGIQAGDTVKLYKNCSVAPANLVAQKSGASGTTASITAADWSVSLPIGTYCLVATTTAPSIADANFATSAASGSFTYERKAQVNGYLLDGFGGIHSVNGAPAVSAVPYYGWDIARDLVYLPNHTGGFELDGFGGIHPFGIGGNPAPAIPSGAPYWAGHDLARSMVMTSNTQGYVLDAYGGIHPIGGAPSVTGAPYFGFDIARDLTMLNTTSGYVLDGNGGIHSFGGAPTVSGPPYYGFDIARDLVVTGPASGYELDGYGGIHNFGTAPAVTGGAGSGTPGSDVARSLVITEADNNGGLLMDAYGKTFTWGDGLAIPRPAVFGSKVARKLILTTS
jgi:hypothetical protein